MRWDRRYDEIDYPFGTTDGLGHASDIPSLTRGLVARGYSDSDLEQILGLNLLRVFREIWR